MSGEEREARNKPARHASPKWFLKPFPFFQALRKVASPPFLIRGPWRLKQASITRI